MKVIDGFRLREVMGKPTIIGEGAGQVDFNKLLTLNETAEFLWRSVEGREFDADLMAALLVEEYGIDEELAKRDATALLEHWVKAGLVQ